MDLDLFNNLINKVKESDFVQNFMTELSNYLENLDVKGGNQMEKQEISQENNSRTNELESERLDLGKVENALYQVVDFSSNGVFLQNTENNKIFEETDIPKELLDKIGNDYILKYNNGTYTIEQELTDDFMNNMIGVREYQKLKSDFEKESDILNLDANTHYTIKERENDYTVLTYGKDNSNTIKVPNGLLPYFISDNSTLCYKNGKFEKVFME